MEIIIIENRCLVCGYVFEDDDPEHKCLEPIFYKEAFGLVEV